MFGAALCGCIDGALCSGHVECPSVCLWVIEAKMLMVVA